MNSILTSVKKLLGIAEECTDFDADIIMYINMALFALVQMGVGPGEGYAISGKKRMDGVRCRPGEGGSREGLRGCEGTAAGL